MKKRMSMREIHLTRVTRAGDMRGQGPARLTESRANRTGQLPLAPQRKVVDRDALVEILSQLRDDVEEALERLNDLVFVIPQQQTEFSDGTSIPVPDEEK